MEKALETLEKVDEIDVDEAVITTAPLYRQYVYTFGTYCFFFSQIDIGQVSHVNDNFIYLLQITECLC